MFHNCLAVVLLVRKNQLEKSTSTVVRYPTATLFELNAKYCNAAFAHPVILFLRVRPVPASFLILPT